MSRTKTAHALRGLGNCNGSGLRILVTEEALNAEGMGDVLCAACAQVFTVRAIHHKHHYLALEIPEHRPHARNN